ncbi:hypothetical protein A2774_03410 [Candidatus Roizmanbacteria bacterium RIFCSPHIGHO2_01_FULL_39_12c]|uniref:Clp ATPase C-terminal domain-containing protein n=1 Tax=Candidatus Roizmanbacteria bacterium RIFCSPHIGHO2_01_FULL_39_12c TaxID=1802031 RepID=A0A1F7G9P8_9BACT|nr:MAG: hypothetical protein A2774_03410 [Candidatus Roizmanbacteria bacterium RIFCSPHIGHO2_01_FULL_39_12c]
MLFDEVEKAHPDIFNILLQILDDGRLTDNKGHVISFKNTVVICTSNIGTKMIQDELLKTGKMEIEEPPVLSTYTFSPRGREILTIGTKYFERDRINQRTENGTSDKSENQSSDVSLQPTDFSGEWKEGMLLDYFAGQEIEKTAQNDQEEDKTGVKPGEEKGFPVQGFGTHAISAKGVEVLTKADKTFIRTSTTAKNWKATTLIDYFKNGVVVNAFPDAPDEQLPTARLKTHTFSPDEREIATYKDRYWVRKEDMNDWQTGYLKDYFAGTQIEEIKTEEIPKPENKEQNGAGQNPAVSVKKTEEPEQQADSKKEKKSEKVFPTAYWDIHTFSPANKEIIIVGDTVWFRQSGNKIWQTQTLSEYFGKDFPLEKELAEKKKVDEEIDKKKYDQIKSRVTGELRKFFRPELLNRFDEVIIFEPLKFVHMIEIVKLQLKGVAKLLEEQDIGFIYTEAAVKEIVREGFDPIYGARPLRRAIQKLIENPISTFIIEKKVVEGNQIQVDFDGESFIFNIEKVELVAEDSLKKQNSKHLFCETCGNKFDTAVVKNSTPICSKCASTKVQEVVEEKEAENLAERSDNKEASIDGKEIKEEAPGQATPQNNQLNGTQKQSTNFPVTHV